MFQRILMLLVVALFAVFLLSKCGGTARQTKSELVAGCTQSGVPNRVCKCVADKIFEHYGDDAIEKMSKNQRPPPDLAEVTFRSMEQCAKK